MNARTGIVGVGVLALAFVLVPPAANAETVGAFAGGTLSTSTASCFTESAGGIENNSSCSNSTYYWWEVPLPVGAAQAYNPTVNITYNSLNGLPACETVAVTHTGTISANGPNNVTTSGVDFSVGSETVAAEGYLYVACRMWAGDVWYVTSY